jgi:hypothetical protein
MQEDAKVESLKKRISECNTMEGCAVRQSTQAVLREQAERQARKTEAFETLVRVIPWHLLSNRDEETLYRYFTEKH